MKKDFQTIKLQIIPILQACGASRSFVFGSYARNESTNESDLDLIVEFNVRKSLLDVIHVKHALEDKIGIHVDLVTPQAIHPSLKKHIDRDKVQIL